MGWLVVFPEPGAALPAQKLPNGFAIRGANWGDLEGVVALWVSIDLEHASTSDATPEGQELAWSAKGFKLEDQAWVATGPSGDVVGYEDVSQKSPGAPIAIDGCVHKDHRGLGVGTALFRAGLNRVREGRGLTGSHLRCGIHAGDENAAYLMAD